MNIRSTAAHRQSGIALIVLLAVLVIVSATILLDRLGGQANATAATDIGNATALAEAKAALIAWAVTFPPSAARESTVGNLPYPDRDVDGGYDGMADCNAPAANDIVLIGRLPRFGEDTASCGVTNSLNIDVYDSAGEPLWYAVSRNVLAGVVAGVGVAGGPINPDMGGVGRMAYPWIQLRDDQGNITHPAITPPGSSGSSAVAAVIFAPGAVTGNQDRSATAAGNFLDSILIGGTTYDNADVDGCPDNTAAPCDGDGDGVNDGEEYVVYPNSQGADMFNDRLVFITVDELMRAAEKRVLGDAAQALRAYRLAGWNTGLFPWLANFRSARAVAVGAADSGSAIQLVHATGNFIVKGVQVGDIVFNLDDDSSGPISTVAGTTISFDALAGGTDNDFDPGDNYEVRPSFKSTLDRRGQLPVHLPNEIFNTSFTADWDLKDIGDDPTDFYDSGAPALLANPADPFNDLRVMNLPNMDGTCMWTHKDRVDCYGIKVLPGHTTPSGYWVDQRTVEVQFSFEATNELTPASAVISGPGPTSLDLRTRSVTFQSTCAIPPLDPLDDCSSPNGLWFPEPSRFDTLTWASATPPALDVAPFLPRDRDATPGDDETWIIRITDTAGPNTGVRAVIVDSDVYGTVTLSGIRYDLGVAYDDVDDGDDELPEWFVENNWHHFIYAAVAADFVGGGDQDCVGSSTCLTVNAAGSAAETDVGALLISSGVEWTGQDRDIGDCDGDSVITSANDSFLCAYFDSDTTLVGYDVALDGLRHGADLITLTQPIGADEFSRNVFSTGFNDQVRIIEPLPP